MTYLTQDRDLFLYGPVRLREFGLLLPCRRPAARLPVRIAARRRSFRPCTRGAGGVPYMRLRKGSRLLGWGARAEEGQRRITGI